MFICSAFEIIRPAGITPCLSAHKNFSYQMSCVPFASTLANEQTSLFVSSMPLSI